MTGGCYAETCYGNSHYRSAFAHEWKSYVVQYTDPETGKKKYHASFRRKDMAQQEANKLRTLLDDGHIPEAKRKRKERVGKTFVEIADVCETHWRRRCKEGSLRKATVDGYLVFLKPLVKRFGSSLMGTITHDDVLDYRADVADQNSKVLANRRLFVMKQVFAKALELGSIDRDRVAGIQYLSEREHERKAFMRPVQVEELLKAATENRAKHYLPLAILLAVEHGAGKQEVLDLTWGDVDLEYGETGLIRFHRTKTNVDRVHRLMPRTREALHHRKAYLEKQRERKGIKVKGNYVVGRLDGSRMTSFRSAWESVCKSLGLKDFHFHDNRHTYCSNIIMAGGTLKHAKEMIGHKTLGMTDRYSHLEAAGDNPMQAALAAHYGASKGPTDT
jgi:integrase